MQKIIRKNGFVYLVEGVNGFETYHNLGKDMEYWEAKKKKTNKKPKKEED